MLPAYKFRTGITTEHRGTAFDFLKLQTLRIEFHVVLRLGVVYKDKDAAKQGRTNTKHFEENMNFEDLKRVAFVWCFNNLKFKLNIYKKL